MYGGGRRGIPREEDEGGGGDNVGDNTDGTDDASVADLLRGINILLRILSREINVMAGFA